MSFLKRLGYYLIGLSIGLIFLAFFLSRKNAQFCYLPNCRVLKELRSKPLSYSESIAQKISNKELDSTDIDHFLNDGKVNFRESDTESKPCSNYIIDADIDGNPMSLSVKNCDSVVIVTKLQHLQ